MPCSSSDVAALHEDRRRDRRHARPRDLLGDARADFLGLAHQHLLDVEQAGLRIDLRGGVGPQPQELVRGRLARDHGADAVILRRDLERHLAAVAHAHVADAVGGDVGQRLHVLDDRDHVLVFERAAVEQLPALALVLDQLADLVVGVVDLGAVAQPRHRVAGGQELLLGPAAVLRRSRAPTPCRGRRCPRRTPPAETARAPPACAGRSAGTRRRSSRSSSGARESPSPRPSR